MQARHVRLMVSMLVVAALLGLSTLAQTTLQARPKAKAFVIRDAALALTMDPTIGSGRLGMLENADVYVVGDQIAAVGQDLVIADKDVEVIDARGKIVMPGFVDTHNHLWQTLIRGCGTDDEIPTWLPGCVYSLAGPTLTREDAYAIVRLGVLDALQTGVTTVLDFSHSFNPEFVRGYIRALDESGMRYVYVYRVRNNPATLEDARTVKRELIDPNPLATLQIGQHPSQALRNDLAAAVRLANELGVDLNVHLLEHFSDRAERPVELLESLGALNARLVVNHVVHPTDEEIQLLAARGVRVTHNPLSNMRLASGVMPIEKFKQAGAKIGLGLDGGANDTSDMFNLMRAAVGLQRAKHLDASAYPTVEDVLWLATMGGAEVLGMQERIGSLTPGKQADLLIIDPATLNFAPRIDWASQLVFNGQPHNVEWVFVAGRPLKAKGKLVGVNERKVVEAAEQVADKVRAIITR